MEKLYIVKVNYLSKGTKPDYMVKRNEDLHSYLNKDDTYEIFELDVSTLKKVELELVIK